MAEDEIRHLRVLIANEKRERLEARPGRGRTWPRGDRARDLRQRGRSGDRQRAAGCCAGRASSTEHALELITEIVRGGISCPVIALLSADLAYVHEAAGERGVFAYIIDGSPEELQSAIDITLGSGSPSTTARKARSAPGHDRAGERS